ncbi:MAG: hypothetical protein WAL63_01225 [Solirubrobacteraceae bacterium]
MPLRGAGLALALCGAIAACGASAHDLSRASLIAKGDAVCSRTDAQAAAATAHIHVAHDPDGPRQAFIKTAAATRPIAERGVAELRALKPPSAMRRSWNRLVDDVAKEENAEEALAAAARSDNTISAAETQQTLQSVQLDLEAAGTEVGLRVCGKAARA